MEDSLGGHIDAIIEEKVTQAKRELLEGLINIRNYSPLMDEITRQLKSLEPTTPATNEG